MDIAGGTPCLACVQLPAPCVVTGGLLNARGSCYLADPPESAGGLIVAIVRVKKLRLTQDHLWV